MTLVYLKGGFIVKQNIMPLKELPVGKTGQVVCLLNNGTSKRRFLDLGITPNSLITTERLSPLGNPIAFTVRGTIIALRKEEIENVFVKIL